MMDQAYIWHPNQNKPQEQHGHVASSQGMSNSSKSVNGGSMAAHAHGASNGVEWGPEYVYSNGTVSMEPHGQSMQQQNPYSQSWAPSPYEMYGGFANSMPTSNMSISPSTLLAQSAHGARVGNGPQNQEAPTTIDPTLMMTINPSYQQYISPTQTQYHPQSVPQLHRHSSYQHYPVSSLAEVVEYNHPLEPQPPPTPEVSQTSSSNATPMMYEHPSTLNPNSMSHTPNAGPSGSLGPRGEALSVPLIDQVKGLLTPKKLDKDPQGTAQKLFDLLLPPNPNASSAEIEPIATDKDTRLEILTRLRDHAPKEFFTLYVKNTNAMSMLKEWGRHAVKKEEFEETLMGWLQVVDRLPLTVDLLIQHGLGKLVKYAADHSPTTAIKDMAIKIESGWRKLLTAQEPQGKEELKSSKKRKAEAPAAGLPKSASSTTASSGATVPPATKKAAIATATGTKAVRRDGVNSPSTAAGASAPATSKTTPTAAAKPVQSDSSFFSAKPKAKLPSFKKKIVPETSAIKAESEDVKIAQPQAQLPSDYNPFADALKAVRRGSPVVPPSIPLSKEASSSTVDRKPGISAKTGLPKKVVRFRPDGELEAIRWIERAIYDDDIPGANGMHGQSWRDMDRAEGSLLKHIHIEVEWYEPPLISMPDYIQAVNRGEFSVEAKAQADRETTALAAIYQGTPPDTPVEPPHLVTQAIDESDTKTMIVGQKLEEDLEGGRQEQFNTTHWLNQLDTGGVPGLDAAQYGLNAQQLGTMIPGGQPQASISDLLNKIMNGISTVPGSGTPPHPLAPTAGGPAAPNTGAAVTPDQAGLLSALMAAQSAYYGSGQPPPPNIYAAPNGYLGGAYGAGTEGYGALPQGYSANPGPNGLPPPLHDGMPERDDDEARWKKSTRGGGAAKKGKDAGKIPASQNTRSVMCTFFAQGKCKFGEDCNYSHDPSKLRR